MFFRHFAGKDVIRFGYGVLILAGLCVSLVWVNFDFDFLRSPPYVTSSRTGHGRRVAAMARDATTPRPRLVLASAIKPGVIQLQNDQARRLAIIEDTAEFSFVIGAVMATPCLLLLRKEIGRRARAEAQLREKKSSFLMGSVADWTTENRQFTQELRGGVAPGKKATDSLSLALDVAKVAVWTWHPAEDKIEWSGPVKDIFGVEAEELSRYSSVREHIVPEDRPLADALAERSAQGGQRFHSEFRIVLPDGKTRWIGGFGDALLDHSGKVSRVAGVNLDISERKHAEQRLEQSERHFRELAESMPYIVWTANPQGEFAYHNRRWTLVTGLPTTGITVDDWKRMMPAEDFARWSTAWAEAVLRREPYDVEFRFFDIARKEYRWYLGHATPVYNADSQLTRWCGTSIDIHERKLAQIQLAESESVLRKREEQLEMLFKSGSVGDFFWDFSSNEVTAHPAVWELFGKPEGHGSGPVDWFMARFHPEDREKIAAEVQAAISGTKPFDVDYRIIWEDGTGRWLTSRGAPVYDNRGRPIQMHGLSFDITDRKLAALQVQESERHFREMADAMPQIVWRSAPNGEVDYSNARWYEYSGFTFAQARAFGWKGVVHPEDYQKWVEDSARGFGSGEPFELEFRLKRALDGAYRWHLSRSVPYRDLKGNILRWFGAAVDIHEQRLSKDRLQAEVESRTSALSLLEVKEIQLMRTLAEKNTLIQEVHHRVKNNLQVISSLLRMQSEVLKDQVAAAALKESHERVLSMALIHEQLYGNKEMDQINFADFTRALTNELLRSYTGTANRITCQLNLEPVDLQIDQAIPCGLILNELVTNALKYAYPMTGRGPVAIDLRETAAGMVTLAVSDQGIGLPAELDWSNSDSLGLPIVDLLTQQLGGTLHVRSNPGTAFTIEFPRDKEKTRGASAA